MVFSCGTMCMYNMDRHSCDLGAVDLRTTADSLAGRCLFIQVAQVQ